MKPTIEEIFAYFGGKAKLARLLGVSKGAVSQWQVNGLPSFTAIEIERKTNGHFKAVDIQGVKSNG